MEDIKWLKIGRDIDIMLHFVPKGFEETQMQFIDNGNCKPIDITEEDRSKLVSGLPEFIDETTLGNFLFSMIESEYQELLDDAIASKSAIINDISAIHQYKSRLISSLHEYHKDIMKDCVKKSFVSKIGIDGHKYRLYIDPICLTGFSAKLQNARNTKAPITIVIFVDREK